MLMHALMFECMIECMIEWIVETWLIDWWFRLVQVVPFTGFTLSLRPLLPPLALAYTHSIC